VRNSLPAVGIVCLLIMSASTAAAYEGSLSYGNGMLADGHWATDASVLTWDVTMTGQFSWHYHYTLDVPKHGVSHFVLETSTNLQTEDFYNVAGSFVDEASWDVGWYDTNPGSPNMPDQIYGIKFELGGDYTELDFSFDIFRDPVWGDFYAKDGKQGGDPATLWNAGFVDPDWDPEDDASEGSVSNHVLVPDTAYTDSEPQDDSPEATTWLLLGITGAAGALARRRRK